MYSQECENSSSKKVLKLLSQSEDRKKYDLQERINFLRDAVEIEPECLECRLKLGNIFFKRAQNNPHLSYETAKEHYQAIYEQCRDYHSDVPYHLGIISYGEEEYRKAMEYFDHFLHFPDEDPDRVSKNYDDQYDDVKTSVEDIAFYAELLENEVPFDPQVVKGVSSSFDEYLPMLSPDNELMFYTRRKSIKNKGDIKAREVEEFTMSTRPDVESGFSMGDGMQNPFNQGDNYGGATISANNKEMFITVCKPIRIGNQRYNNCDIYVSRFEKYFNKAKNKDAYRWTELENLGPVVNTEDGWESQPSLSADGNTLYFATIRKSTIQNDSGEPTIDIYFTERGEEGKWSNARSLGAPINTPGNDKSPFMHGDSKTLYFSSNGLPGVGGYDIYFSRLNNEGKWSEPKNLGVPINTEEDEHGLIVSTDGNYAYYASKQEDGVGGLDIFSFELPEALKPQKVLLVKGKAVDEKGEVAEDAKIQLKYIDSQKIEEIEIDKSDGTYVKMINMEDEDVLMTIEQKDKAFQARIFTKERATESAIQKIETPLQDLEVGKPYKINDIYYETASSEIDPDSKLILAEFAEYLKKNHKLQIAIHGHTDDVGSRDDNMELSIARSKEVMQYLKVLGVPKNRMTAQGFGPDKPIASNDHEEGRAKNRRTEFVITSQ